MLSIDHDEKTIELFEPHGHRGWNHSSHCSAHVMKFMLEALPAAFGQRVRKYKQIHPMFICPFRSWGLQSSQPLCGVYTILYITLVVTFPDRKDIATLLQLFTRPSKEFEAYYLNQFFCFYKQHAGEFKTIGQIPLYKWQKRIVLPSLTPTCQT